METIETLIPDNKGNHLVVVLYFYDNQDKYDTFQIPDEFLYLDIADINIRKPDLDRPLGIRAFNKMCNWLLEQFVLYPNAVFSFICSTESINIRDHNITPEQYRWNLFECFYVRSKTLLSELGIKSKDIIVGPLGFQTGARVFFRERHSPIIHVVEAHLKEKY